MIALRRLLALISRFKAREAGTAAVEFALILPIMLTLFIGANEVTLLISVDRKAQLVSGAVGDLVARSKDQITTTELGDYVKISSGLMAPFPITNMEQIVTQVKVSNDGTRAVVSWSRGYQNQTYKSSLNRAAGSNYANFPQAMSNIAKGQYVIVAETRLAVRPLYGLVIQRDIPLYRENFYLPRFEGEIQLK